MALSSASTDCAVYTRQEMRVLLLHAHHKRRLLRQLLRVYARIRLGQTDFPFLLDAQGRLLVRREEEEQEDEDEDEGAEQGAEEAERASCGELLALSVAAPPPPAPPRSLYRGLTRLRHLLLLGVRGLDSAGRWLFALGAHLNDRLVFRDLPAPAQLLRPLQQLQVFKLAAAVNPPQQQSRGGGGGGGGGLPAGGGLGLHLQLSRLDSAENALRKLQAPPGCGLVVAVDLALSPSCSAEQVEGLRRVLLATLQRQLEGELKASNRNLHSLTRAQARPRNRCCACC